MSDSNIFISNGTCYSAAGQKLDGSFIPCGNVAYGHQTCCGKGDNCLADNACFGYHGTGYGSQLTYLAGCTDPDYKDAACPKKEFDQPWIALTLCDNSDGVWAPCSQEGNPTTLQPGSYCSCTDASKTTAAFSDASSLANFASLPQSTGESIQFFVGHVPTGSPTPGTITQGSSTAGTTNGGTTGATVSSPGSTPSQTGSTTSSSNGSSGTPSPSETGTTPPSPNTNSGLNTSAKIGIGVGVGVAVLLLLGVIAAFLYRRRMRRHSLPSKIESGEKPKPIPDPTAAEADGTAVAEADGRAAQPFGLRKELVGSEVLTGKDEKGAAGRNFKPYRKDPVEPEADGQPLSEVDGRAAQPWGLRTELEGSRVPSNTRNGGFVGGEQRRRNGSIAELPGSERFL